MPHPDMSESWVNGHPDEGLLHEWLDEQLSRENAGAVESHVTGCADCRALVAEARGLIAASHRILSALDEVPANVMPVAAGSPAAADAVKNVAVSNDLDSRFQRARNDGKPAQSAIPRRTRWNQYGKIAALLLVVLAPAVFLLRGNDVTVPKPELNVAESPVGGSRSAAAAMADSVATPTADAAASVSAPVASAPAPRAAAPLETAPSATAPAATVAAQANQASDRARNNSSESEKKTLAPELPKAAESRFEAARADAVLPPPRAPGMALSAKVASVDSTRPSAEMARGSGSAVASLPSAATPPVTEPPRVAMDVQLSGRAAGVALANQPARRGAGAIAGDSANRLTQAQLQSRRFASAPISASTPGFAIDSLVVLRTVCATACETTTLHVTTAGAVRYSVSSGNTNKPAVTSQLTSAAHDGLLDLLFTAIPRTMELRGQLRCTVNRASGAPELEVLVVRGAATLENPSCGTPAADLRKLGFSIDSIANTAALRRRIP